MDEILINTIKAYLRRGNVFITAPSGYGKTNLTNSMVGQIKATFVHLDHYGETVDDKFLIKKLPEIPISNCIIEGAPNFYDHEMAMIKLNVVLTIIPVPTFKDWKMVQKAKAEEGKTLDLNPQWIKDWEKRSNYTQDEYDDTVSEFIQQYRTIDRVSNILIYTSPSFNKAPTKGWEPIKTAALPLT